MKNLYIPKNYDPLLGLVQTERAIKEIKDFFQINLSTELRLRRVTAPLYVKKGTGINDDLNGIERPVTFPIKALDDCPAEIVHSLAKWKRLMLADFEIPLGYGIYTDMNAIRPDEDLDNIHSLYVDQWDWESVMSVEQRNVDFLQTTVKKIFEVMKRTEYFVFELHPQISPILPDEIKFIHAEELVQMYPQLTPKEREDKVAEQYKTVFVVGIGGKLSNGEKHDGRAPDYDDWITPSNGYIGLNGDILVWNPILQRSFELSSMGIRVSPESLMQQLEFTGNTDRKELFFHKRLLNGELPQSIGGGIGQSRLCMFFLRKAHIGETQVSIWPDEMISLCKQNGIDLL
jgi:aspartate--ammonia ligase